MWKPDQVRLAGRLDGVQTALWTHLLRLGHARTTAIRLVYAAAHLIRWLVARELSPNELSRDRVHEFVRVRRDSGYYDCYSVEQLDSVVQFLKRKRVAARFGPEVSRPSALEALLGVY